MNPSNLFNLHNDRRRQWGRDPFKYSNDLAALAQKHADFLDKTWLPFGWVAHYGWSGRAKQLFKNGAKSVAENVAIAFIEEQAMQNWMYSTDHRNNIMGNYNTIGISVRNNKIVVIFAQYD